MSSYAYSLPEHRRCPKCDSKGAITDWRPGSGLDPATREYKCIYCRYVWYFTPHSVDLKYVAERQLK